MSTACNWIFNYMIVQITPISLDRIGYRTYIIFAVLNTAWLPFIYFFFPETKGLELEDVDRLFMKGDEARMGLEVGMRGSTVSEHAKFEDTGR